MPKFPGHERQRPMRFLRDFERYISAIDTNSTDFNYVVFTSLEGIGRGWWELVSSEQENLNSFREKFIKKFWHENVWFQISSELQFRRHIPNGNLSRVEYAIKIIKNAKDLIPPPPKTEIVAKIFRRFRDDIRISMIIRNTETYNDLIELLDAFDQTGPSNLNSNNNSYNYIQIFLNHFSRLCR